MNRFALCEGYNAKDAEKFYQMGVVRSMTPVGQLSEQKRSWEFPNCSGRLYVRDKITQADRPISKRSRMRKTTIEDCSAR